MTQAELNRAVARSTGETISTVAGMGFVPLRQVAYEREPLVINWYRYDRERRVSVSRPRKPRMAVA